MIDHERNMIVLDGKEYPIEKTEVWWRGPLGAVPTLKTALEVHKGLFEDQQRFALAWSAMPVAISKEGIWEQMI